MDKSELIELKNSCSNIRILIYHDIKTKKQIKLFKNQKK